MSLSIHGIPQRESLPDKRREALQKKMEKAGEDSSLLPITPATVICYGRIGSGKSSVMYSWLPVCITDAPSSKQIGQMQLHAEVVQSLRLPVPYKRLLC
jgi:hypothetical protein